MAEPTDEQYSWRRLNPDSRYELFIDGSMDRWVRSTFASVPALVLAWAALPDVIFKADLFRLLILFAEGGVYTDSDTVCLRPIADWLGDYRHLGQGTQVEAVLAVAMDLSSYDAAWLASTSWPQNLVRCHHEHADLAGARAMDHVGQARVDGDARGRG